MHPVGVVKPGNAIGGLALALLSWFLLIPSGLFLVLLGFLAMSPSSDSGESASGVAVVGLFAAGVTELLLCLPVMYLFARDRALQAMALTGLGVAVPLLAIWAL